MRRLLLLTIAIVFNNSCNNPVQSTFDEIESLDLNTSESKINAFYSDGYLERANETIDLLENSTNYFYDNFQVSETFSLAVLDSIDWIKITQIPYGLPFVSGPPYIVCMPATSENILAKIISDGMADFDLHKSFSITKEAYTL